MAHNLPPCPRKEHDCFALHDKFDVCRCLDTTDFDRPCPFYKPKSETFNWDTINRDLLRVSKERRRKISGV